MKFLWLNIPLLPKIMTKYFDIALAIWRDDLGLTTGGRTRSNLFFDCELKTLGLEMPVTLFWISFYCTLSNIVGLSKRRIIEPSFTAFIGFPCIHVRSRNAWAFTMYIGSGVIMHF